MDHESCTALRFSSRVFTIRLTSPFLIMSRMCGRPSPTLLTGAALIPFSLSTCAVPRVASRPKPNSSSSPDLDGRVLVAVPHADEGLARLGQFHPGGELRLDEGLAEGLAHAHDLAGGFHLRPEDRIDTGEFDEREYRLLHRVIRRNHFLHHPLCIQALAHHAARRNLGQRQAARLDTKG